MIIGANFLLHKKFEPMARIELATYSFAFTSISPANEVIERLDCILNLFNKNCKGFPCQSFGRLRRHGLILN